MLDFLNGLDIVWILIIIAFVHLIADFFCQTDNMALNKSKSIKWLSIHVLTYTLVLSVLGWKYAVVNGAIHWVTDFFTSKLTSKLHKQGKIGMFFNVIGVDQYLHFVALALTARYLTLFWWNS